MYKTSKGVIYTEDGLPYQQRIFCDNRLAFCALDDGIGDVDYFNAETKGHTKVFWRNFWGSMKFYLNGKNGNRMLRAAKCEIYPFGYKSVSELCEYSIYTIDDAIFITVVPNEAADFTVEFYEDLLAYPDKYYKSRPTRGNVICKSSVKRNWKYPVLTEGEVRLGYTEGDAGTYIRIFSSVPADMEKTSAKSKYTKYKVLYRGLTARTPFTVTMAFSHDSGNIKAYDYEILIKRQYERYKRVSERAPVLKSGSALLDQYFELIPLYHESLKVTDFKGAIRPQTLHYWIYGWDSLTSNESTFYWGDNKLIEEMLSCFEENSDEHYGIAHMFSRDTNGVFFGRIDAASQGMYITLLDLYRMSGGDFAKYYAFAKKLFDIIISTEIDDTGFVGGNSLYPDFAEIIGETGNDISCFNNTVCYCAMRSMSDMALAVGDYVTAETARNTADKMRKNFALVLFNERLGFFDSSADASTFKGRGIPTNNAVKWENDYCECLISGKEEQCLEFYEKNLISPAGLRPFPNWAPEYDGDANQLHCWWPVMSEFYTRLINKQNRPELIRQYVGWVSYWSEKLMCPEGISCYDDNAEVPFDSWNCCSGIWHGYSMRGFYNAVVHSVFGVSIGMNRINFHPYSGEEMELTNLHFGNKTFDIKMLGSGGRIEKVFLNGENIGAVYGIALDKLALKNKIEIYRVG